MAVQLLTPIFSLTVAVSGVIWWFSGAPRPAGRRGFIAILGVGFASMIFALTAFAAGSFLAWAVWGFKPL